MNNSTNNVAASPVVVIPSLNPGARLVRLVDELSDWGLDDIIVIDDGSADEYAAVFDAAERRGATVLHHARNLGKGAAIKTALYEVVKHRPRASHVVTMDADGQHLPRDVARVCDAACESHDVVVLGARDFGETGVPWRSRLGNAFSAAYFKADTGRTCRDTQTGLRAIPASLFSFALAIPGMRYDYEMNFLTAVAKRGLPLRMVPISTVYENGNAGSHFSPVRDSALIYRQLVRFTGSSCACSLVDLGLFALLTAVLNLETALLVAIATIVARICSGTVNFLLNRRWSFADLGSADGDAQTQVIRYILLFFAQMIASMLLVMALAAIPAPLVILKVFVDVALFFISYFIQRNWVFKGGDGLKPSARHAEPLTAGRCENKKGGRDDETIAVGI